MSNIVTSTKLKKRIEAEASEYGFTPEFSLRNIRLNGPTVGCSGFITNPSSGKIVYVMTEQSAYGPLQDKIMYREAKSTRDYTGGTNKWGNRLNDEYVGDIVKALTS